MRRTLQRSLLPGHCCPEAWLKWASNKRGAPGTPVLCCFWCSKATREQLASTRLPVEPGLSATESTVALGSALVPPMEEGPHWTEAGAPVGHLPAPLPPQPLPPPCTCLLGGGAVACLGRQQYLSSFSSLCELFPAAVFVLFLF